MVLFFLKHAVHPELIFGPEQPRTLRNHSKSSEINMKESRVTSVFVTFFHVQTFLATNINFIVLYFFANI